VTTLLVGDPEFSLAEEAPTALKAARPTGDDTLPLTRLAKVRRITYTGRIIDLDSTSQTRLTHCAAWGKQGVAPTTGLPEFLPLVF